MQILSEEQLVGQTLGNYRIEHLVGKGQLTAVYLARHMGEQRIDALTLYLMPESFSNASRALFLARFRKEAALITTLDHPHILPVYTHGEVVGSPYLVTPYMMHGSLADMVKQQGCVEHEQVRLLLHQIVKGLSYAHARGFIHGTLKPANIVWRKDDTLQVAGFGLMHMLQLSGMEQGSQQYAHLLSISNTFLAAPEYVAPEVVAGQSIDQRSDIYALGCILFELLSGQPPFSGSNPLEVALQHANGALPSLRTVCPHVPITLSLVIAQAMMRDPAQRFQNVSDLDEAFTQASLGSTQHHMPEMKAHPANGFTTGQRSATGSWQFLPPIVTGRIPVVKAPENTASSNTTGSLKRITRGTQQPETGPYRVPAPPTLPPPVATVVQPTPPSPIAAVVPPKPAAPLDQPAPAKEMNVRATKDAYGMPKPGVTLAGELQSEEELMKTYGWWSNSDALKSASAIPKAMAKTASPAPAPAPNPGPKPLVLSATDTLDWGLDNIKSSSRNKKYKTSTSLTGSGRKMKRRRVLALLGTGVVAAGIGAGAAFKMHAFPGLDSMQQATQSSTTTNSTGAPATKPMTKKNNATKSTHTGTVIGEQTLAKNAPALFTNPIDKQGSLLIHLASGSFVAYERACTHQGVPVNYDPKTQMLVCPAHGAIFDPAKGGAVVQGPATTPIANVKIRVNSDGTITV